MINDWTSAQEYAQQARQLYEAGRWEEALSKLLMAVEADPHHSDWHFGLGLILDALDRFDEAVRSFQAAWDLGGDDPEVMLYLAEDLIRIQRYSQAIEVLERVSELDPACEPSYCLRIVAYAQLGDHEQAEQMFYLAQQVDEHCPKCFDYIAHSLAARGQLDRAIWCWQKVLDLDPAYRMAWVNLSRVYRLRGQGKEAERCLHQELRHDPDDLDIQLQLAELQIEMGRYPEARQRLSRVIEQDPATAKAHLYLALISIREGHLTSAAAALELANRLDGDLAGVNLGLAQVAWQRGNRARARGYLEVELGREGRCAWADLELARLLIEVHWPRRAARLLSERLDPLCGGFARRDHLVTAMLYRSVALMMMGRVTDGVRQCRRALKLAPHHAQAIRNLVIAHLELGQVRRAGYWLDRLTRVQPGDAQARRLRFKLRRAVLSQAGLKIQSVMSGWITRVFTKS